MNFTPYFKRAFVVSLLLNFSTFGQFLKIDSLRNVLKTQQDDSNKVHTLDNLSRTYYFASKPRLADSVGNLELTLAQKISFKKGIVDAYLDIGNALFSTANYTEALKDYTECLKVAEKINSIQSLGRAYSNIGNIHYMQTDYPDAFINYSEALKYYKQANDKKGLANVYTNIGNIYMVEGNFPEALKNQLVALTLKKGLNDKRGIGNSYGNIGSIYNQMGNYSEALKNHLQSVQICEESGNKVGAANAYVNIGNDYEFMGNQEKALENDRKSLEIDQSIGNKNGITIATQDIGGIYKNIHNYDESLKYYLSSLTMAREIGDRELMAMAYENVGYILIQTHKLPDAKRYLDSSLQISIQSSEKTNIRDAYSFLAIYDSAAGNYKTALDHYKLYVAYRDSLKNEENTRKVLSEQMTYDFEQKEAELKAEQDKQNTVNEERLKRQKLITLTTTGASVLILILILLLFNRARLKQKNIYQQELNLKQKEQANAVMETQEQERKRIAEDLHDSLGHLLSTIKLNLQASSETQKQNFERSLELLQQASREIHNITFNLMPRTLEEDGLVPALQELANRITHSGSTKINLHLHEADGLTLEKQVQFTIYRIIQEAVNNILKYAESKEINIQLINQTEHLTIMIEDDGKGFDPTSIKQGRGLKNMQTRSEWLNGSLAIDSAQGHGTTITVEIPL